MPFSTPSFMNLLYFFPATEAGIRFIFLALIMFCYQHHQGTPELKFASLWINFTHDQIFFMIY